MNSALIVFSLLMQLIFAQQTFYDMCVSQLYTDQCFVLSEMYNENSIFANQTQQKISNVEKKLSDKFKKLLQETKSLKKEINENKSILKSIGENITTLQSTASKNEKLINNLQRATKENTGLIQGLETQIITLVGEIKNTLKDYAPSQIAEMSAQRIDEKFIEHKQNLLDQINAVKSVAEKNPNTVVTIAADVKSLNGKIIQDKQDILDRINEVKEVTDKSLNKAGTIETDVKNLNDHLVTLNSKVEGNK